MDELTTGLLHFRENVRVNRIGPRLAAPFEVIVLFNQEVAQPADMIFVVQKFQVHEIGRLHAVLLHGRPHLFAHLLAGLHPQLGRVHDAVAKLAAEVAAPAQFEQHEPFAQNLVEIFVDIEQMKRRYRQLGQFEIAVIGIGAEGFAFKIAHAVDLCQRGAGANIGYDEFGPAADDGARPALFQDILRVDSPVITHHVKPGACLA